MVHAILWYSVVGLNALGGAASPHAHPTAPGAILSSGVLGPSALHGGVRPLQAGDDKKGRKKEEDPKVAPRRVPKTRKIVVVVSKRNPIKSLTKRELARVFLRKKHRWPGGEAITVYERPVKREIRQRFSRDVLNKRPEALKEYWMNLQLTKAMRPPKVLRSATLVKRYLKRVKGGIGYLYEHELDDTVKALTITRDGS